jgi:pyruvate dehydrogenase E2 component (dihydrolipoamide acetyltransferase)
MAHEIKMPQLSDTMDSGKILVWHKKEGDSVKRGEVLAEVETDKANLEIEAFQAGTLLKIATPAGTTASVGQIIAYIGEAGTVIASGDSKSNSDGKNIPAADTSKKDAVLQGPLATAASKPEFVLSSKPVIDVTPVHGEKRERVKASPLARKLAEGAGVDLTSIVGSGPGGRVVRRDVENVSAGSSIGNPPAQVTAPLPARIPETQAGNGTFTPLSKMRSTIARRMQETVQQSPHFYVRTSICMDQLVNLREGLKNRAGYEKVSLNHFVIKAAAYALTIEPSVNCALLDGMLFQPAGIHIGIVTAVKEGLLIPVIRNTNTLSLKDLAFEVRAAVERARAGRPSSTDLTGGTFSISNMGMFDVDDFTALINPGQGAILAVSSVKQVPVVRGGRIEVGQMMNVTLSVDHRIIDGVMAGNFLKALKDALENPTLLFL